MLAPIQVLAQEVTPTPDNTQATETPTPAPSDTTTPTPAATETVTPTPSVSETVTPTPSETAAPTPTDSVTPTPDNTQNNNPAPTNDTNTGSGTNTDNQANAPPAGTPTVTPSVSETTTPTPTVTTSNQTGNITADKLDYAPTDIALITGSNLTPNTQYNLTVSSSDNPATYSTVSVTTDANGGFVYSYQLDGNYRPNYSVVLNDLSGNQVASTSFTDGTPHLVVAGAGTGNGSVTSTDGFINCTITAGATSGTCSHTYGANFSTTLTETPAGSTFTSWSGTGGCTGAGTTCAASATGNNTFNATATFTADTTAPVLQSFSSSTADGIYGPGSNINVTANYNEPLDPTSDIQVTLNNGQSVFLANVSGSSISGTYTVGATGSGQDNSDLTVSSIGFQNAIDLVGNGQTATTLPGAGNNIADTSNIVIDTTAPVTTDDVDGLWHNADVTVHLSCTDASTCDVVYYTTDGSTPTTASATGNSFTLSAEGTYTIKYFGADNFAHNQEAVKTAANQVMIDKTNPTDPTDVHSTSHTVGVPSAINTIEMGWTAAGSLPGATDALSGVNGYSFDFTNAPATPDTTVDAPGSNTGTLSSSLAPGTWYFNLRTEDNAGNWTSTVHVGPFIVAATQPDLTIVKTNNTAGVGTTGVPFNWVLTITNSGTATANFNSNEVVLIDDLPSTGATYGTVTSVNGVGVTGNNLCSITTNTLTCASDVGGSKLTIPAGGTVTVTVPTTPTTNGSLVNPRAAGSCAVDPDTHIAESNEANNSCANTVTVGAATPDLTVVKTNDVAGTVDTNSNFNWILTITNSGSATATFTAGQFILHDDLPQTNASYGSPNPVLGGGTSGSLNCNINGSQLLICAAGGTVTIPAGGTITVTVPLTAGSTAGSLSNPRAAGICAVDPNNNITEGNEGNNSCANSVTVTAAPDLTVNKTNNTAGVGTSGVAFNWVLTITNNGTSTAAFDNAHTLVLVDDLPATGATYGTVTSVNGAGVTGTNTCSITANTLTCTSGNGVNNLTIPAGDFVTVTVPVTPTANGTLNNPRLAGICSVDPANAITESSEIDNSCSDTVTVGPATPDLTIVKTNDAGGTVSTNTDFNWILTINNTGSTAATFASGQTLISDNLPNTNATYGTVGVVTGSGTTGSVTCSINGTQDLNCTAIAGSVVIPVGGTVTVTVPVTAGTLVGSLANPRAAGVCSVDPNNNVSESNEGNNSCSDTVNVTSDADLIVTKTNNLIGFGSVGVAFNWILTITNNGATTANFNSNQVVLTDDLPSTGATYGTVTSVNGAGVTGNNLCSITANTLTCISDNGTHKLHIPAGASVTVTVATTPTLFGILDNPRFLGICTVDPNDVIAESNEVNNNCSNTVLIFPAIFSAPIVTEVTPVPSPTSDNTPDYTFNTDQAGTISYGGDCSSATTTAVIGNNTVTFNTLSDGLHNNCTIVVSSILGGPSLPLNVSPFTVNTGSTSGGGGGGNPGTGGGGDGLGCATHDCSGGGGGNGGNGGAGVLGITSGFLGGIGGGGNFFGGEENVLGINSEGNVGIGESGTIEGTPSATPTNSPSGVQGVGGAGNDLSKLLKDWWWLILLIILITIYLVFFRRRKDEDK